MNKAEAASGAAFVAIGAAMMLHALGMPYLLDGVPGPGFLPRWIAAGLITAGMVIVVKAVRPAPAATEPVAWPSAGGWRRVALMAGALAAALIALNTLGFLVTTTVFVAVVIYGLGIRSWRMLASVPLLAACGLYLVFAVWLNVPLPKGLLAPIEWL
jgi:hypothetical protein